MAEMTVQYPDDLLVASGKPRNEVEEELRFQLAVRLFEVGQLSLGKAAELANCGKPQFAERLAQMKIAIINLDEQEIETELSALRRANNRR